MFALQLKEKKEGREDERKKGGEREERKEGRKREGGKQLTSVRYWI